MTDQDFPKEFFERHPTLLYPTLFVKKLRKTLTDEQIIKILEAMDDVCQHCWDDPPGCQCWNDESTRLLCGGYCAFKMTDNEANLDSYSCPVQRTNIIVSSITEARKAGWTLAPKDSRFSFTRGGYSPPVHICPDCSEKLANESDTVT